MPGSSTPASRFVLTRSVRVTRAILAVENTHKAIGIEVASARAMLCCALGFIGGERESVVALCGCLLLMRTEAITATHDKHIATINGAATAAFSDKARAKLPET